MWANRPASCGMFAHPEIREKSGRTVPFHAKSAGGGMCLLDMGRGTTSQRVMPIITLRLDDPASTSVDERDERLMLLVAPRQALHVEWTEILAAAGMPVTPMSWVIRRLLPT